ncbi:MAG TPA: hypothetical protein VFO11_03480 [Candidatus Polarisedimenticolaceae bacterium]|nr:hypothetical protein [Candidatus Polarisedimenticolaceae bacterium]
MRAAAVLLGLSLALSGCAHLQSLPPGEALTPQERHEAIRRAAVWSATDIPSVDLEAGPDVNGAFASNAWVACEYKEEKRSGGHSPKFVCETSPGHEVKVKYGPRNAEVFGEVLSTRLFWALGFAADAMYPVRVRCRGCPTDPEHGPEVAGEVVVFDPAAIERKLPGRAMETRTDSGWTWSELEEIGPEAPPGARAQRDGLKLLVAFVQHTDSKAANQRLLCPKGEEVGRTGCRHPVLMVNDLGLTFGHAGLMNRNVDSVSLATWAEVPVWRDRGQCVAELKGSFTGSLGNPKISEAGRAFLAGLLVQLSDAQLRDLFETARVKSRSDDPSGDPAKDGPPARVNEWVTAFKLKRAQIVDQRCPQ